MCTAAKYISDDFYFGRTLDNDCGYNEQVVITPRNRPLVFKHQDTLHTHHAMIGVALVQNGYPLYFDAINEKGLAMAGLNFVGATTYRPPCDGKCNIAQFEFIPWILSRCTTVREAKEAIAQINLTDARFADDMPVAQLHWMIADRDSAITVESTASGINVYDNEAGVLTNCPSFPEQMINLTNYMGLSSRPPENNFCDKIKLEPYCRGMGGIGMPGDLTSPSRFVRAAFTALNSPKAADNEHAVSQFFHILGSVDQPRGSCILDNGEYETTIYTSCCNVTRGIYYYTTYDNRSVTGIDMNKTNINGNSLIRFPMRTTPHIVYEV